jgi:DNA-binding transcriptional LysR family regulator
MDRMAAMATFAKVVEAGGFAAAARKLKMSPSTVTEHIQSLETRLGVRLLNRSTRKLSVTDVGKSYYERCLQILADADDADNVVQASQSTPRGKLNLNASVAIPPLLAPVIAEFTALYPEVTLSVNMSDRMLDIVEEGFDLAIRIMPVPESSLIVKAIGTFRLVLCGAPDYFTARGTPAVPDDLISHNCLNFASSPWGGDWRFSGPDGEQTVAVSGNMETNSANALRLAAVNGQGLALLPGFLVVDEIRSGRLVPVLAKFLRTEHSIYAVYPHRHHLSAKVRSFLDLVTKHHRENPAWADPCKAHAEYEARLMAQPLPAARPERGQIRLGNAAAG